MSPSATPATQNEGGCDQVPLLPRETTVDVAKCHACHAKPRWMPPSATPATWNEGGCRQVPPPATQSAAASPATKTGPSAPPEPAQCQPSAISATPAMQSGGRCRQVPRLPRKVPRRHRRPKRPQAHHQSCSPVPLVPRLPWKRRFISPSATPATWNESGCHQVPPLPRKVPRRHRRLKRAQARHQSQPSAISATPAAQRGGSCRQVPRLPRETKAYVAKCHACHAKCRGVTGD